MNWKIVYIVIKDEFYDKMCSHQEAECSWLQYMWLYA